MSFLDRVESLTDEYPHRAGIIDEHGSIIVVGFDGPLGTKFHVRSSIYDLRVIFIDDHDEYKFQVKFLDQS